MGMMNIKEYHKNHFNYNPVTGKITRDDRANSNGSLDHYGYLIIKVKGKQFKAHRLAWLLHYGDFPENEIDHINCVRNDNRICNLRDVTRGDNNRYNKKKRNKDTGEFGIYIDRTKGLKKKYGTRVNGKTYRFYTIEEAKKFKNESTN